MESFTGKLAVVTGGGTGMGRELTRQLAAEGCHVAICDVSATNMADTLAACEVESPPDTRVTSFVADVSDEAALVAFRDHVEEAHDTDHLDLLFNNAGIGGGGSVVEDPRDEWERVFNVCWGGVYLGVRTFLPLLLRSAEARIVNTSSVNGFWATLGPTTPHTAYSSAKFAVKGFSEALITDLAVTAPNVGVSVVMPGHIGTDIVFNSGSYLGRDPKELDEEQVAELRDRIGRRGLDVSGGVRRGRPQPHRRDGRGLPRQRADVGGRGGDDHPRGRAARALADPRRRRRPPPRRGRAPRARARLHRRVPRRAAGPPACSRRCRSPVSPPPRRRAVAATGARAGATPAR